MSLRKARKAAGGRTDAPIGVVEWQGELLRFRRPTTASVNVDAQLLKDARADYLEVPEETLWLCHVIGSCYLPDEEDGGIVPWRELADIALDNDLAFSGLASAFEAAFPEFSTWLRGRLKNLSGAQAKIQDDASPESPSNSDNSPES